MTTEQAITSLHSLIDVCISRGGIFSKYEEVAAMRESISVLIAQQPSQASKGLKQIPQAEEY